MSKKEYFDAASQHIKNLGFRVFVHENKPGEDPYYYGYFSDGKNIGYFQLGYFFGVRWSTVNGPGSHGCGSGFSCEDEGVEYGRITRQMLEKAFVSIPSWYRPGRDEWVVKWRDLQHFLDTEKEHAEKGWFHAHLVEV